MSRSNALEELDDPARLDSRAPGAQAPARSGVSLRSSRPLAWLSALDRPWPATTRVTPASQSLRLAGVTLHADLSCVFGGLLTAWTFAAGFLPETNPGIGAAAYWTAGTIGALFVMGSLLLHELGHAIAARRAGLAVSRITLSFVGGTSETHVVLVETVGPGLPATVAALVAIANLAVALLNAIPGLPLDGGRVLCAVAWRITGHHDAATRFATAAGRRFGELLIVLAIFASAFGFVGLALWAVLLGFVLRES